MTANAQLGATPLERALGRSSKLENVSTLYKRSRFGEDVIRAVLLFCGVVSIFTTLAIVFILGRESLLFLSAEAWLPNKIPVVAEGAPTFEVGSDAIAATDDFIAINFVNDDQRRAYLPGRFVQLNTEIMSITARTDEGITVERGLRDTDARLHNPGTPILPMVEEQIKTLNALSNTPESVNLTAEPPVYWDRLALDEEFLGEYAVGDRIRLGVSNETMRISAIEDNFLVVERGVEDIPPQRHAEDETIGTPDAVRVSEFFTNTTWSPTLGEFGILPLVTSTLTTSAIAMLVAIPLGLGAAVYLSEYARPQLRRTLKPILEILAGVPTVVYGYFAIKAMTPFLQSIGAVPQENVANMLSAGLVMGIMIVPTISSMSEDALSAVPRHLREASYGLGGTRLETTAKVVIPAALSGILASFIVGISRAVGETMIVAIAAGGRPNFTFDPRQDAETMTGHIVRISKGDLPYDSVQYNSIFAIGITLFVLTLTLNIISGWIVRRYREVY
ncbi:MAG: phosphate ABC transporter permease subunit PstC [Phototrophicaceae bacterium]